MPRRSIPFGMSLQQEYEVEKIVKSRFNQELNTIQYFVKWKGYTDTQNSWEPEWNLSNSKQILNSYKKKHKVGLEFDNNEGNEETDSENSQDKDYHPTKSAQKKAMNKEGNNQKGKKSNRKNSSQKLLQSQEEDEQKDGDNISGGMLQEEEQQYTRFVSKGKAKYVIKKYEKNNSGAWMFDFQQQQFGGIVNMTKNVDETMKYIEPKIIIMFLLNKLDKKTN